MQKILVIGGCTAVGKSDFALNLSNYLNMEIISADSVQVYKGLEIATSKPTKQEQKQCKHHLVDIVSPFEKFNAYDFVNLAKQSIFEISNQNKLPVVVGGTGLYIDSLIYGFDFATNKKQTNFDTFYIYLTDTRENIYKKINLRVDKMIEKGLVSEVKTLRSIGVNKDCQCMQAIGYKEIWDYLDGEISLEQAIEEIKKNTRNYAKRQDTWFKHDNCEQWDINDKENLIKKLLDLYPEYTKKVF